MAVSVAMAPEAPKEPHEVRGDRDVALVALRNTAAAFPHVPAALQLDRSFVLAALAANGCVLEHVRGPSVTGCAAQAHSFII